MLYSQIIAVCADIHTKPTNTVCRHHAACHGGTWSNHWAKQLKKMFPNMTSVNTPFWHRSPLFQTLLLTVIWAPRTISACHRTSARTPRHGNSSSLHCTVSPLTLTTKYCRKQTEIWGYRGGHNGLLSDATERQVYWWRVTGFSEKPPKNIICYEGNVNKVLRKRLYLPKCTVLNPSRQTWTQMASLSDWWHNLQWIKCERKNGYRIQVNLHVDYKNTTQYGKLQSCTSGLWH
jgi:hypothetical protein